MILNLSQLREDYKNVYRENWQVAQRIDLLIEATKLDLKYFGNSITGKKIELTKLLLASGVTLRTLQRWKKSYRETGGEGLMPNTRGHKKAEELTKEIKSLIKYYRSTFRWGSEVIQAHLFRDDGHDVTRYKIERYLNQSGLKDKYPCSTKKKQRAEKKKKHTKKVYIKEPGAHTQMDIKYQLHLLSNRDKAYVYNFVDHASNWSFKRAYSQISAKNTKDFMERLLKECPFIIKRLQTMALNS
jgi:transposase